MSATTTINGKPQRKQLSDQLDRLDTLLDVLNEGLPGAVANACREGARVAVKDAIVEVLTNPELRGLLAPPHPEPTPLPPVDVLPAEPQPTPPPPSPSLWKRVQKKAASAWGVVASAAVAVKEAVKTHCRALGDAAKAIGKAAGETLPLRRIILIAIGVGAATGLCCWLMPHTFAVFVAGLGVATTAVWVQIANWFTAVTRKLGLLS